MLKLNNQLLRRIALQTFRRWNSNSTSSSTGITVNEFQIPASDGNYIAGKLWKGIDDPSQPKRIAPILCLHGWLDNACSFDPLLPLILKPNMTAVAIDFPGHGFSSHFTNCTHYDPLDASVSIHRVLRHFEFEKVILLGHSMGSAISFICTGTFPELVEGYIALDNLRPIPSDSPIKTMRKLVHSLFEVEAKLARKLPVPAYTYDEAIERSYLGREKSISREGCKILLQRGAFQRPDGKYSFGHDLRVTIPTAFGRFTAEQSDLIASNIKCKVCIIKGEPGYDYEPRQDLLKLVDSIRRKSSEKVEFHLVPGTHHFHLDTPELIAPIINKFLWS